MTKLELTPDEPEAIPTRGAWVGLDDPRPVVVSWGGGVQSKAIGLLVERGDLPKPAAWVFADTGAEPAAIYRDLERWAPRLEALGGFHIVKHPKETLTEHLLRGGDRRIPVHVEGTDGRRGPMQRRACTGEWKIIPIQKWRIARFGTLEGNVQWLGISRDEAVRAKPDGSTAFPLLELHYTRVRCVTLLREAGEPATRSACVFCPYRSNAEWSALTADELAVAAAVEDAVRASWKPLKKDGALGERGRFVGPDGRLAHPSLHSSGAHVRERPWEAVGGTQTDLTAGDCGGHCFV